jgi:hypothetical protein
MGNKRTHRDLLWTSRSSIGDKTRAGSCCAVVERSFKLAVVTEETWPVKERTAAPRQYAHLPYAHFLCSVFVRALL